uniref:Uncharacterized protein n=1 Tax=Nicotiana tabacum TaxID=4097 RepID=A0A1S4AQA5_TOBAC|nr:PREDICTED: uncharacterized protein LOC107800227 [Nicotiana tabacum]
MGKAGFNIHTGPVEAPCLSEYNFNVDVLGIMSAIGKIKDARWPKPVLSDPSQRNPNLMCRYHGTHSHRTEDCRQLREEVAHLFNEGHLCEFLCDRAKNHFRESDANRKNKLKEPHHVIHMIVGGDDALREPVFKRTKISTIRERRTRSYIPEDTLTFSEEDNATLYHPHNNALLISFF